MSPQHRLLWDIFRPSGSRLHQMKCANEIMQEKIKSFKRSELVFFSPSFYTFGKRGLITSCSPVSLIDGSVRHFGWSTRRKSLLASARRCVFRVTCGACNRLERLFNWNVMFAFNKPHNPSHHPHFIVRSAVQALDDAVGSLASRWCGLFTFVATGEGKKIRETCVMIPTVNGD